MEKILIKLISVTYLLLWSFCSLSQHSFKEYVRGGYDQMDSGRYEVAINLLLQAKSLKGVDTGYTGIADLYLGNCYEKLQKMKDCVNSYIEALKFFEGTSDDLESLAFLYNHLGNIELYFLQQYTKAIGYYRQQLRLDLLRSDTTTYLQGCTNMGIGYQYLERYDSAFLYFEIVLANNSIKNQSKRKALLAVSNTYSRRRQFDIASGYYDQAIPLIMAANDSVEIFMVHLNKGDCLLQQKEFKNSIPYFIKTLTFINDSTTAQDLRSLYYNLAEAFSNTNDTSTAYRYKKLEADISDSIITRGNNKAVADAETKYGTQKILDDNTISQQEKTIANNRSYAILGGSLVVCIIAFLALRNATLRKKANTKLAAQKAQVEALAANLEQANQTKARLFSVISHDLRSPVSSLYASLKMQELKGGNEKANDAVSSHIMHLLDTLEDLLTWSKSQMDRFTLQPVTLRISDVYDDLIELHQDAAAIKQITIENKAERPVKVYTDENLLKTILRNVLANSISHAPNTSTVVMDAAANENGIVCTISNEATATDAAMLEERLQTATIGSSKHGLGNVLIKEFTEKLNADFDVNYMDGKVHIHIRVPNLEKVVAAKMQEEVTVI